MKPQLIEALYSTTFSPTWKKMRPSARCATKCRHLLAKAWPSRETLGFAKWFIAMPATTALTMPEQCAASASAKAM